MKKQNYLFCLLLFFGVKFSVFSQVGINTTTPMSTLDINGNLSLKTVTLNGNGTGNGGIAVLIDDGVYISADWDKIYEDFLESSNDSVEYISSKMSSIDTSRKLADFITSQILERLKADNVQSKKVYVCISNNWDKTWFDSIEEV
jgi:hypothetical protein